MVPEFRSIIRAFFSLRVFLLAYVCSPPIKIPLLGTTYLILFPLSPLTNICFIALDFAEAASFVSIRAAPKKFEKKEDSGFYFSREIASLSLRRHVKLISQERCALY